MGTPTPSQKGLGLEDSCKMVMALLALVFRFIKCTLIFHASAVRTAGWSFRVVCNIPSFNTHPPG